ncbi:MAG: pentapeptide repeat-containing protein [Chitinophagales bacterium]|nr:pentapeptide repeat-containing protein [Chitinophagales bacterium]
MKAIRIFLTGVLLGAVCGWALGFLRFPYVEKNLSFLLGFVTCIAVVLLGMILLFIWNRNKQFIRLIGKDTSGQNAISPIRTYSVIWIAVSVFVLMGGLISGLLIYRQNELIETQSLNQNRITKEQNELMESLRRSNLDILLRKITDRVDEELKNNPARTLNDNTIASIVAAFNYSFAPYRSLDGDSLSARKLSPEKGQLLLALCERKIDSASFDQVKRRASFSGADLRKMDFSGVNFDGADLKGADLKDADLNGASLIGADLRDANLWGVKLNKAKLTKADARRADLRWAQLNEAWMDTANLDGADLSNAQLRKANLRKAKFRTAKLNGALLNEANMEGGDIVDASLQKANLTKTNLTNADFTRTNFMEAIMTDAELVNAVVEKDWFEKLDGWQIAVAKEIQKKYKIVHFENMADLPRYHLERN